MPSDVAPGSHTKVEATGYSFPSGHTTTAGPIYGGLAVGAWKKYKWLSAIFVILALITGFSRNYLGVHHPQDVIVGFIISLISLFAVYKIFGYLQEHPEKENMFLLIAFIAGWIAIAYITFKPYPMTYVNGELLVDPQKMMNDGYGDIALIISFAVARFIERSFISFKAAALKGKALIVSIIGLIPLYFMINYMKAPLDEALGSHWGHFTYTFIVVMYCIAGVPAIIKMVSGKEEPAEVSAA